MADVAVALLEAVTRSSRAGDRRHLLLSSRLAGGLVTLGRTEEAERLAEQALADAQHLDLDLFVALHHTLGKCRRILGKLDRIAEVQAALDTPGLTEVHRAHLWVEVSRYHGHRDEIDEDEQAARRALAELGDNRDPWVTATALNDLTYVCRVRGEYERGLELAAEGEAVIGDDPVLVEKRLDLQMERARQLGLLGRHDEGERVRGQVQLTAERVGDRLRAGDARVESVTDLFHTGRWDEALAEAALAEEMPMPSLQHCYLGGFVTLVRLHRGDLAAARRLLAAIEPHRNSLHRATEVGSLRLATAGYAEGSRRPEEALALLRATKTGAPDEEREIGLADGVRLALLLHDDAAAIEFAAHAAALPHQDRVAHRRGIALHCEGLLAGDPALLVDAAAHYERAQRLLPQAQALESAGEILIRNSARKALAREAFDASYRLYSALGAAHDLSRLRSTMHRGGVGSRRSRQRADRSKSGWDSLTAAESTVADLVARGLSNSQIANELTLSRRTVETHMSNILRKLGLRSRVNLAIAVAERASADAVAEGST